MHPKRSVTAAAIDDIITVVSIVREMVIKDTYYAFNKITEREFIYIFYYVQCM